MKKGKFVLELLKIQNLKTSKLKNNSEILRF